MEVGQEPKARGVAVGWGGGDPDSPSAWAQAGGQVPPFPSSLGLWLLSSLGVGVGNRKGRYLALALPQICGLNKWPE